MPLILLPTKQPHGLRDVNFLRLLGTQTDGLSARGLGWQVQTGVESWLNLQFRSVQARSKLFFLTTSIMENRRPSSVILLRHRGRGISGLAYH